jgi:chromosome segregation ATPase
MEQLKALGVEAGDSATESLTALKTELVEEKVVREKVQAKAMTLAQMVEDLKKSPNRFNAQIPALEEKVKHLDNKVIDTLNDAHAKELSLERVTKSNEDYKSQNAKLTKKLESKSLFLLPLETCTILKVLFLSSLLTPL